MNRLLIGDVVCRALEDVFGGTADREFFALNDETGEVSWDLRYSAIAAPQAMHIHLGGAGESGVVVVPLNVEAADGDVKIAILLGLGLELKDAAAVAAGAA